MRRWIGAAAVIAAAVAVTAFLGAGPAAGNCGHCGPSGHAESADAPERGACEGSCPMKVDGARVTVTDIRGGVRIEITASNAEAVRAIREKARACKRSCEEGRSPRR